VANDKAGVFEKGRLEGRREAGNAFICYLGTECGVEALSDFLDDDDAFGPLADMDWPLCGECGCPMIVDLTGRPLECANLVCVTAEGFDGSD